jgi:hypothetical protein
VASVRLRRFHPISSSFDIAKPSMQGLLVDSLGFLGTIELGGESCQSSLTRS